ncbi:DNA-directed RNA polymerase 1B [Forsythia ovata]|uniref:DNA-directed RNA polymerase 1B n=1 Tax=Forsythia ovata TaxID=205694 RepID=A0ABD1WH74_9LAMI
MVRKNKGICHSCRQRGHNLSECQNKHRCPVCGKGFVKWMEMEKRTMNLGRLFFCCSSNCGYFKWSDVSPLQKPVRYEGESSGLSSTTSVDDPVKLKIYRVYSKCLLKYLNKKT